MLKAAWPRPNRRFQDDEKVSFLFQEALLAYGRRECRRNAGGDLDRRLQPKERVAAVTVGDVDVAFPFSVLEQERVVNYSAGDRDIVVFFKPGTVSALDRTLIVDSKDVGSTGVFDADLDGRKLTFGLQGEAFTDNQTGSVWNILGKATSGPLAGSQLTPVIHGNHFWFAWGAFKPNTVIYRGAG